MLFFYILLCILYTICKAHLKSYYALRKRYIKLINLNLNLNVGPILAGLWGSLWQVVTNLLLLQSHQSHQMVGDSHPHLWAVTSPWSWGSFLYWSLSWSPQRWPTSWVAWGWVSVPTSWVHPKGSLLLGCLSLGNGWQMPSAAPWTTVASWVLPASQLLATAQLPPATLPSMRDRVAQLLYMSFQHSHCGQCLAVNIPH